MTARIQVRRDTNANWSSNDPILFSGEFGFTTDTGDLRIGDGVNNWSSLPVVMSKFNSYTPTISQGTATNISKTVTYSKYLRTGDLLTFTANLLITSTGDKPNDIVITLPVQAATSGLVIGSGYYWDNNGTQYPCLVYLKTATTISLIRSDTSLGTQNQGIGTDPNINADSNDVIKFTCTYEVV